MLGNVHTEFELMIVGKMAIYPVAVTLYIIFGISNAMCCYVWYVILTVLAIYSFWFIVILWNMNFARFRWRHSSHYNETAAVPIKFTIKSIEMCWGTPTSANQQPIQFRFKLSIDATAYV